MLCISAVYAVMRCPSVHPSVCLFVTFVDHVKTNKHIFEIFHHRVATPFLFFHTKRGGDIPTGTLLTGASNAGGYRQKWRFWSNSWLSKIAGRAKCQNLTFTDDEAEYDTVGHAPLAIDRLLYVRTTK